MRKNWKLSPVFWSSIILIISQALTLVITFREKVFVESYQITSPQVSIGLPVAYFFGAVVILGLILVLVPMSILKIVLRIVFALMFSWGVFIVLGFFFESTLLPITIVIIAGAVGLVWLLVPKIWLHDLLMILTLASVGSVFGFLLAPWTTMLFMLVISVYDVLAVRLGYMLWMANRLSQSETLPAFIIPVTMSVWNRNLREYRFQNLEDRTAEREFSILGGGDIGFPLLLAVSVYFAYGLISALIVGVFSLLGLISAFWIQALFLKGKPMPALPPIAFASLIGFLIVYFI